MAPRLLSGERGFGLVEALIATALAATGLLATVGVFGRSQHTTISAQRTEGAIHIAQEEIEQVRQLPYDDLMLAGAPGDTLDPQHPVGAAFGCWFFQAKTGQPDVVNVAGLGAACRPGTGTARVTPTKTFTRSLGGTTLTGTIYRYVTWRDETCPSGCSDFNDTKRVTIAVKLDPVAGQPSQGPLEPIWLSDIVTNPKAIKPGGQLPPATVATAQPRNLYMYSSACGGADGYAGAPSADTKTHNSANWGGVASSTPAWTNPATSIALLSYNEAYCENAATYTDPIAGSEQRRPDLMGGTQPADAGGAPLRDYSTDLPRGAAPAGGLQMRRLSGSCSVRPRYFIAGDQSRSVADYTSESRWNTHAWASKPIASELRLRDRMQLSFFGANANGASGNTKICVSLIRRKYSAGVSVQDDVLVDASASANDCTVTLPGALDTTKPTTCNFSLDPSSTAMQAGTTPYWVVPGGGTYRLIVVVRVVGSPTPNGAVLAYDHSSYPSFAKFFCDPDHCPL